MEKRYDKNGEEVEMPNNPELSGKKIKFHNGVWSYDDWVTEYKNALTAQQMAEKIKELEKLKDGNITSYLKVIEQLKDSKREVERLKELVRYANPFWKESSNKYQKWWDEHDRLLKTKQKQEG